MTGQFKQPHYPHNREGLPQSCVFAHTLHDICVKTEGGHKVNNVDRGLHKLPQIWRNLPENKMKKKQQQMTAGKINNCVKPLDISTPEKMPKDFIFFIRTYYETYDDLKEEPDVTHQFHVEESLMWLAKRLMPAMDVSFIRTKTVGTATTLIIFF